MTAHHCGWHLVKTTGKWFVRYLEDGRSYLCDPASYERHCKDSRVPCNFDLIVCGPDSLYSEVVKISPPKKVKART